MVDPITNLKLNIEFFKKYRIEMINSKVMIQHVIFRDKNNKVNITK